MLKVKRDGQELFLLEAQLNESVDQALERIVRLHNGRLKVKRICDELKDLAQYGIKICPEMAGLLESQIQELRLTDPERERCVPAGGADADATPDPLGRRGGPPPKEDMKQLLLKTAQEVEAKVASSSSTPLDWSQIKECLDILDGAVKIVYPMGLPDYDPIKMELQNCEDLTGTQASKEVVDPTEATLWFANKEMDRKNPLSAHLGKNEKTKVIVKLSTVSRGQPTTESWLDGDTQKKLAAENFKRMEQLRKLALDEDDSYLNSQWADGRALKNKFNGLENVTWK